MSAYAGMAFFLAFAFAAACALAVRFGGGFSLAFFLAILSLDGLVLGVCAMIWQAPF